MNDSSHPKRNSLAAIVVAFMALGLSLLLMPPPADAGPALQPPRPTIPGGPPGGEPGGGEGESGGLPGTTIHGSVVNWNYHNQPHAKVMLRGGGWAQETISDDNGYYYFKGLGTDNVFLNLALPEGSGLTPMTTELALRLKGSEQLMVNLGLYSGPTAPGSPVGIIMSVEPKSAVQGDTVLYTIQVTNGLPHGISQVLVTDYLPEGLVPVEITVSPIKVTPTPTPRDTPTPAIPTAIPTPTPLPFTVEIWGNLVIADIGEMAVKDAVVVTIKARVGDNVPPGTVIENRASFVYAESVAVQAMASLPIGGVGPTGALAKTPAVAAIPAAETLTTVMTPTIIATPGSPDGLPVTGFSLPIAGLLFVLLILLVRLLRPKPVDET